MKAEGGFRGQGQGEVRKDGERKKGGQLEERTEETVDTGRKGKEEENLKCNHNSTVARRTAPCPPLKPHPPRLDVRMDRRKQTY